MGRPAKAVEEKKKQISFKLHPNDIALLNAVAKATGFKVNTILEQGMRLRIDQLEKQLNGGKSFVE